MNVSTELPAELALQVRELQSVEPMEADVREAQRKLDDVIRDRAPTPLATTVGKWALAAAASCLAVVVISLLPTAGQGVAFAQVQRHFQVFKTLSFVLDTRANGETIQKSQIHVNEAGEVRTDVGDDLSVLVSPPGGQVLMLMHDSRTAMRFPIDVVQKQDDDPLTWLEELAAYQRAAQPLGTRVIEGQRVHGWALEIEGMYSELWADDSGLPLWLQVDQRSVQVRMDFAFDQPLPATLFSFDVPQGYTEAPPED